MNKLRSNEVTEARSAYWTKHPKSGWYAFLSFLSGFRPKFLGTRVHVGKWYDVYHNDKNKVKFLVDKETGHIFERKTSF